MNTNMGNRKNRKDQFDLKAEIEEEMKCSGYERSTREARFVSLDFIADLFKSTSPPKLRLRIQTDLEILEGEGFDLQKEGIKIKKLIAHVRNEASKLYSVLLLAGQSHRIVRLYNVDHPLTDRIFEKGESSSDVSYCSLEYLKESPHLSDIADKIFEYQWYFPPILHREIDQKFPVGLFRFPFQTEPTRIAEGGGGRICKVKVAEGHLEAGYRSYIKGSVVVHKEVTRRKEMTENNLMREVNTIRARTHPNIVPFFASFSAGRENPWDDKDKTECLHMLFEHTDAGDMHDWLILDSAPTQLANVATRKKHITDCIDNLISAVTFIHSAIQGFIAYHHDLKPKNILRFNGPPAVWKICDFGMANLKHHEEESGTTHGPDKGIGTYDYQPPEYFTEDSDPRHGRPFDVYSLGCILLELATVWKHGWSKAGIREFRRLRGENTEHACISGLRKPKLPKVDYSFHNSPNVVEAWIHHLREGEDVDENFMNLLDLISEMLVVRTRRIFVWEVDMDLYEMRCPRTPKQLESYLRKVVQPSDTSLNNLSNGHNPLKRAIQKKKHWQEEILRQNKWSVSKPEPNEQLTIKRRETGTYHTTLAACPNTNEFEQNNLFGRHDMDVNITEGLRVSNCVGLYGISGIGKSHLAYHYVVRFQDTDSIDDRKHTFWVEANNEARFRETVHRIAEQIQLEASGTEDLFISMKKWLSDSSNGPWIMVVDGLDNSAVAAVAKRLIPKDCGQILITTNNRGILDGLDNCLPRERKKACFHVEGLAVSESQRIFQWHNDDVLLENSEMEDLLTRLSLPVLIKLVARYCLKNNISTSKLYKAMKDGETLGVRKLVYGVLMKEYLIFEPLISIVSLCTASSFKFDQWPSPELKLLGQLSCLNKAEIDIRLIQQDYENETRLWEMMGLLENCFYIAKGRSGNPECYFMHETVQELVRQWVLDYMGPVSLLELHATALSMLITLYKDDLKKEVDAKKIRRYSYRWKLRFMSHFERFLVFAREFKAKLGPFALFQCPDRMVHSVITFSQVYLDEGRYDDAVCVLEFTRRLYKGTRHRASLVRHLSKAYISLPLARTHEEGWIKAINLLKKAIHECTNPAYSEQKWLCILDLADLYSKSLRPEEASAALKCLPEVSVEVNGGRIYLQRRGKITFEEKIEPKFAIRKRIAEAKVHFARAKCSAIPAVRSKELGKAHTAFSHAKSAIASWFPGENEWELEVEEGIAQVLCKMDSSDSIREAIDIFRRLLNRLEVDFIAPDRTWSQNRMWVIECQIACAQLQLGAGFEDLAIGTLKRVLGLYERCYGQHDEHTRVCAHYLYGAYKKIGKTTEAQEVKERYSLRSVNYVSFPDAVVENGLVGKCLCVIVLLLVIWVLVYLYNPRWGTTLSEEL